MTVEEVRALVLSFPDASEAVAYGKPAYKVAGKFFTRLRKEDASLVLAGTPFLGLLGLLLYRGLPALTWAMLTQAPRGGFYLGGGGGIAHAILGTLLLGAGGLVLATLVGLPAAFALQRGMAPPAFVKAARFALDVLWGTPSIVTGAFLFVLMVAVGARASLLAGMLTLALVMLPILVRCMDQALGAVAAELKECALSLGANRLETYLKVVLRQALPGLMTALLLALGRGLGDAASVMFTAGYTDQMPHGLLEPVASLPLAVFYLLGTPIPEVQARAYAAALVLFLLVLAVNVLGRFLSRRFSRHLLD